MKTKHAKSQLECTKNLDKLKNQSKNLITMFFKYANVSQAFGMKMSKHSVLSS